MFNLLPDNLKKEIKTEYKTRLLTMIFIFVIIFQFSLFIFVLPSWVISSSKEKDMILETEDAANAQFFKDSDEIISTITSTNVRLGYITSLLEYPKVRPFADTVISSKNSSIHLTQFTYAAVNKTDTTISIQGVSATREALISFSKTLQDSKMFKTVDLPISNLAKDKDIVFSMTLTIKT